MRKSGPDLITIKIHALILTGDLRNNKLLMILIQITFTQGYVHIKIVLLESTR